MMMIKQTAYLVGRHRRLVHRAHGLPPHGWAGC